MQGFLSLWSTGEPAWVVAVSGETGAMTQHARALATKPDHPGLILGAVVVEGEN